MTIARNDDTAQRRRPLSDTTFLSSHHLRCHPMVFVDLGCDHHIDHRTGSIAAMTTVDVYP